MVRSCNSQTQYLQTDSPARLWEEKVQQVNISPYKSDVLRLEKEVEN